jgi:hypothetical protein
LGWRSKVATAGDSPQKVARLHNVLALFKTLADQKEMSDRSKTRITTFSDNVVLSHSLERQRSLIFLLGMIQVGAAMEGHLVRGGLTAGQIFHTDKAVFGPALNRAYELESKIAVFPRIVVDPEWLHLFKDYSFIVTEQDVHFFDFFNPEFSTMLMQSARDLKAENEQMIDASREQLEKAWNLHPLAKVFLWLREEVRRPLGEAEWKKVAWLYDRIAPSFGEKIPAKSFRRTILHGT